MSNISTVDKYLTIQMYIQSLYGRVGLVKACERPLYIMVKITAQIFQYTSLILVLNSG